MSRGHPSISKLVDDLESWQPFTPISSAEASRLAIADLREKNFTVGIGRDGLEERRPMTTMFEVGTHTAARKHQSPSTGLSVSEVSTVLTQPYPQQ